MNKGPASTDEDQRARTRGGEVPMSARVAAGKGYEREQGQLRARGSR